MYNNNKKQPLVMLVTAFAVYGAVIYSVTYVIEHYSCTIKSTVSHFITV